MTFLTVSLASNRDVLPLRVRYRAEANCQITKDSIHTRAGWTRSWLLHVGGVAAGFGSIAEAGPWKDKPTVFEFYLLPEHRQHAFDLFEQFLAASGARFFDIQTIDEVLTVMLHTYGREIATEKIVLRDGVTTTLPNPGVTLQRVTSEKESRACFEERAGGSEWRLEMDGQIVGTGGILFHYNYPYGDIYMDVPEAFRRRGFGSFLVQELKRVAYAMGSIPAARCNPDNIASRRTLLKAGFAPYANILNGVIDRSLVRNTMNG